MYSSINYINPKITLLLMTKLNEDMKNDIIDSFQEFTYMEIVTPESKQDF